MKKVVSIILIMTLAIGLVPSAFAASNETVESANALYGLGLFNGTGYNSDGTPIFDLDKVPTRNQAVTMLVRLLGKAHEAEQGTYNIPFTDVDGWAKPYIGFAYANGLTSGTSATSYSGSQNTTAAQYITFVLRALGYTSGIDFQYNTAWEFSDSIGLTDGRYSGNTTTFTRGDVAVISYRALSCSLKGQNITLIDRLRKEGAISEYTPTTNPPITSQPSASLNYESIYITPGETVTLTMPDAGNKHITWTSSDPEYIRVSNGVVSVFKNGGSVAKITATTEDGLSASCIVMMKSTDEVVKKFTSINVYKKFPAIPSFDNVSPSTPLWTHFDLNLQEFGAYIYNYVYLISNLDDAEYLAKEYAYWLKSLNYTLIREEDDPIIAQSVGSDIIYELSDPTNRYIVSIKGAPNTVGGYDVTISIDYSKSAMH
ncbi:S-layer homology domain-containing protein [Bacteroides acidifaciens]|uniref:S-layer homology domain-containing protein n=1 Tax=Bacteroides acidifaciens TaxID=85831 RepID=UPI0026EC088E|nr:S-layer homology domain-containing protein [Bacteroides acidifaciens]